MKNLPVVLPIAGVRYSIKATNDLNSEQEGTWHIDNRILVAKSSKDPALVLFHEVLHAIHAETGLEHMLSSKLEHALIQAYEKHLWPLLPKILKVKPDR